MNDITFGSYVGNGIKEIMKNMEDSYPPFGIWIPVTDELPKEKGLYMVSIDPRYLPPNDVLLVDIWGWDGKNWRIDSYDNSASYDIVDQNEYPVVAWMQTPKPYLIWDGEKCVKPI